MQLCKTASDNHRKIVISLVFLFPSFWLLLEKRDLVGERDICTDTNQPGQKKEKEKKSNFNHSYTHIFIS